MSQQQISRRELEDLSVLPFKAAAGFVKRHPIPTGFWLLGLGLCFLFTGFVVPKESYDRYESGLANLNQASLDSLETSWENWKLHEKNYQMSKGWFWSCDRICLGHKSAHDQAYVEYTRLQAMYDQSHAELKGELGCSPLLVSRRLGKASMRNTKVVKRLQRGKLHGMQCS